MDLFSDLLTSNLEQFVLFFLKGSESMKFYTHHISSGMKKLIKRHPAPLVLFFLGENGPSHFQPKTSGWYIVWVGVSFVEPLISTDYFLRVFWVEWNMFHPDFSWINGQHCENIYETSSFPVNLLGVMHHFETHIISTAETVQRGKQKKLMSPPLWKQKEFLKWNSTQYDSMWKTWFK